MGKFRESAAYETMRHALIAQGSLHSAQAWIESTRDEEAHDLRQRLWRVERDLSDLLDEVQALCDRVRVST